MYFWHSHCSLLSLAGLFPSTTPIFDSFVRSAGKSTGGGHVRQGPLLVIPFANLDQMIYHQTTGEFAYWYAETEKLVRCRLLSLTTTYPVDIPYYRE